MSAIDNLRYYRNILLDITDKYSLPDYPHSSDTVKQSWLTYRQSLRDLTSTQTPSFDSNRDLINVTWPTDPNGESGTRDPDGTLLS